MARARGLMTALAMMNLQMTRGGFSSHGGATRMFLRVGCDGSARLKLRRSFVSSRNLLTATAVTDDEASATTETPQLLMAEGLFAVDKPLDWTSNDVVGYLRGILERNARDRGCVVNKRRGRGGGIKVGHGGTLDPLATGVLVIGVGKGTKLLQK
jgi:TruB family pseudouridylate synthase (N terminal domain)